MKNKDYFILYSVIALMLILLFLKTKYLILLYIACIILIFPILFSFAASWLDNYWRKFGKMIGKIQSSILLGLLYISIFPIVRLFKKKSVQNLSQSTWEDAEVAIIDFTKQW